MHQWFVNEPETQPDTSEGRGLEGIFLLHQDPVAQ